MNKKKREAVEAMQREVAEGCATMLRMAGLYYRIYSKMPPTRKDAIVFSAVDIGHAPGLAKSKLKYFGAKTITVGEDLYYWCADK